MRKTNKPSPGPSNEQSPICGLAPIFKQASTTLTRQQHFLTLIVSVGDRRINSENLVFGTLAEHVFPCNDSCFN